MDGYELIVAGIHILALLGLIYSLLLTRGEYKARTRPADE
jgi:hypothetical protein